MKEILIIVISLLLVIVGSNISQAYLNKTGNELTKNLEELREEIRKAQSSEENNSNVLARDICSRWEEIHEKWSIIIAHNELDSIELSLVEMKTCIEEEEYTKSIEKLEKSVFLLNNIKDKEKLDLKNIF